MTGTSPIPPASRLTQVREIRDLIQTRVRDLVEERIDAIESDPTSHQWRLAKLLPQLIQEFGDTRSPEVIRGCADRDPRRLRPRPDPQLTCSRSRTSAPASA